MPNEILLGTLDEISQELGEKQAENNSYIKECRATVDRLSEDLRFAEEEATSATRKDEEVKEKQAALRTHLNSLTEKPRMLQEKLESLQGQQFRTYRIRSEANETVGAKRRELEEAKTHLAAAEKERETIQKEREELSEQIRRVSENA